MVQIKRTVALGNFLSILRSLRRSEKEILNCNKLLSVLFFSVFLTTETSMQNIQAQIPISFDITNLQEDQREDLVLVMLTQENDGAQEDGS